MLDRGLLNGVHVVEGVRVITAWGRNGGVRVISANGPSYFLKQARSKENRRWLNREAHIYQWLRARREVAPMIPTFYGFDHVNGILIIGLEPDAKSQWLVDSGDRKQPPIEAAHMAAALARLHQIEWHTSIPVAPGVESNSLPHARWLTDLSAVDFNIATESSATALDAIRVIQADAQFCRMLREVRSEWDERSTIHGDIRAANIIIRPPVTGEWRLTLIDWEIAGFGDPCWDIGCYFSTYLTRWVRSIPFGPKIDIKKIVSRAVCPMSTMQHSISTFWETYAHMMALGRVESDAWLLRALRLSALRLLQLTLEAARSTAELTPQNYAEIQLARNILEHPEKAAHQLLGVAP